MVFRKSIKNLKSSKKQLFELYLKNPENDTIGHGKPVVGSCHERKRCGKNRCAKSTDHQDTFEAIFEG